MIPPYSLIVAARPSSSLRQSNIVGTAIVASHVVTNRGGVMIVDKPTFRSSMPLVHDQGKEKP